MVYMIFRIWFSEDSPSCDECEIWRVDGSMEWQRQALPGCKNNAITSFATKVSCRCTATGPVTLSFLACECQDRRWRNDLWPRAAYMNVRLLPGNFSGSQSQTRPKRNQWQRKCWWKFGIGMRTSTAPLNPQDILPAHFCICNDESVEIACLCMWGWFVSGPWLRMPGPGLLQGARFTSIRSMELNIVTWMWTNVERRWLNDHLK